MARKGTAERPPQKRAPPQRSADIPVCENPTERGLSSPRHNGFEDPSSQSHSTLDANLVLDPLPKGWVNRHFGDICHRVKDTYTPSEEGDASYLGLEHLASGIPALLGRGVENEVRSSKTAFKAGDVLFGKLRPYLRKGAQPDFDGICSTDILVFRASENCESEFLRYLIHSDPLNTQDRQHRVSSTREPPGLP